MLPIEEVKKWLIENRTDENGDLDLSGLDFSDFDGDINISEMKVKGYLCQDNHIVGGGLFQNSQTVGGILLQDDQKAEGRIINDLASLNDDFKKMSPAEKGKFIRRVFAGDDGTVRIEDVDLSRYHGDVMINRWTIDGSLGQYGHKVGGDLFQHHQEAKGSIYQNYQEAGCDLYQDEQEAEGRIMQVPNGHEGEPKCVGPDCEAECERLRKELREADRKNEVLLWALGKAMEVGK